MAIWFKTHFPHLYHPALEGTYTQTRTDTRTLITCLVIIRGKTAEQFWKNPQLKLS